MPKNYDDLLAKLLKICPDGELLEDNDQQLVFYTGLNSMKLNSLEPIGSDPDAWLDDYGWRTKK